MTSTVPSLPLIVHSIAYLCMIAGVALIMFRPFFPGLAVMLAGIVLYVAYHSYTAQALAGMGIAPLVGVAVVTAIGLSSSWWSEKLGLRFTYMNQQVMWGAVIGAFVGIFIFGVLGMLLGLMLGVAVMELRAGRKFQDALRQGAASLLSMLGPRGFQLVMALLVCEFAIKYLGR